MLALALLFVPFCGGWQPRIDPSGDRTARQWVISQQGKWPGACPVGTSQGTVWCSGTRCTWGVPSAVLCLLQNSHLSWAEHSGVQLSSGSSFGEQYWASACRQASCPLLPTSVPYLCDLGSLVGPRVIGKEKVRWGSWEDSEPYGLCEVEHRDTRFQGPPRTGLDPIVTDTRALLPTGKIGCERCAQWPMTNPECAAS